MLTFVFKQVLHGLRRSWILYLANTLSMVIIVLLFAYIDGSRRQLDLQSTVFSGEVVFSLSPDSPTEVAGQVLARLREELPTIDYAVRKLHTTVQYSLPGSVFGACELVGARFEDEPRLRAYLTLKEGRFPTESREILLPSSILQKTELKVGDPVRVIGKTAANLNNSGRFRVSGFYDAPSLTLFDRPRFLVTYDAMESFYQPETKDVQYGVYYRSGIPEKAFLEITQAFASESGSWAEKTAINRVSSWDFQNIAVQFNVFLLIMISITIFVLVTVVFLVNFNVYMVLLRKRRKEFGTLLAFGVSQSTVAAAVAYETLLSVALATAGAAALSSLVAILADSQRATGPWEILIVLLSGTNRIDFFVQGYQLVLASGLVLGASLLAQVQNIAQLALGTPQDLLSKP